MTAPPIAWVEERTYRLHPGAMPEYLERYEASGMPTQLKYLPWMLGYYSSEFGGLNEVVHLWGHGSLDQREQNRARMRADPAFKSYWASVKGLIQHQSTRLLRPAPFFAARLAAMQLATHQFTLNALSEGGSSADSLEIASVHRGAGASHSPVSWDHTPS